MPFLEIIQPLCRTLTSPVLLLSSFVISAGTAITASPLLEWRPLESEAGGVDPFDVNAAPEDVDLVIPLGGSMTVADPLLEDATASGDLGGWGCLALNGLVDRDLFESNVRPTLEALDPRLKIREKKEL